MKLTQTIRSTTRILAAGTGLAAGAYAAKAALAWHRYGRIPRPDRHRRDELLDRFMPSYEVVERHYSYVAAPAALTLSAAKEQNLFDIPLIRAIFRTRAIVLGARPKGRPHVRGLLKEALVLGWGVLADQADREVVVGAVTQPWEADVIFRSLPPDDFAPFAEPGFVKIVWTLRVHPIDSRSSIFLTETRAVATDATARGRFRRYWAFASPGIALIRRLSLGPLKRDAERRARLAFAAEGDPS